MTPSKPTESKECKCGRPVAYPYSELVCTNFPHCQEESHTEPTPTERKECCDLCLIFVGERRYCKSKLCPCHTEPAHAESEGWEKWTRVLSDSTNPKDTDLLIAKLQLFIAQTRQEAYEEGKEAGRSEADWWGEELNAAIKSGFKQGKESALADEQRHIAEAVKIAKEEAYKEGFAAGAANTVYRGMDADIAEAVKVARREVLEEVMEALPQPKMPELVGAEPNDKDAGFNHCLTSIRSLLEASKKEI